MTLGPSLGNVEDLLRSGAQNGLCVAMFHGATIAPALGALSNRLAHLEGRIAQLNYGTDVATALEAFLGGRKIGFFAYSGAVDRLSTLIVLSALQRFVSDNAIVLLDNADFTGVYDGLRESLMAMPPYRLHEIYIDSRNGSRAGQGIAVLSFDRSCHTPQERLPESKNKRMRTPFSPSTPLMDLATAKQIVRKALSHWMPGTEAKSREVFHTLLDEFPDGASPKTYWHEAYGQEFTGFFSWGHDQDFGFGFQRQGTMSTRHIEIVSESIQYGYLPPDLTGLDVLDVGCWTGGDVLALAGMGARVTAIEEHPVSAGAAKRLCELLSVPADIQRTSLYLDRRDWKGRFDLVYISGVIYHVTDPMLALRICLSYLKPGGRVIVETKASRLDGPLCEYAGTHEKGWNWYSPTLETLGRWMVDAGFERGGIRLHMRPVGRLLAAGVKNDPARLPERAGFSRPESWLEEMT